MDIFCRYSSDSNISFKFLLIMVISDNSVTSLISHDRGGEWKTIHLADEQCKGVNLKVS